MNEDWRVAYARRRAENVQCDSVIYDLPAMTCWRVSTVLCRLAEISVWNPVSYDWDRNSVPWRPHYGRPAMHAWVITFLNHYSQYSVLINSDNAICYAIKSLKQWCHYHLSKFSFTDRIVNIWNSLPNSVVKVDTVDTFQSRLDTFWTYQDVKYDFTAGLKETGDRSEYDLSLIHIWRCRRIERCRSRWSPYH